MAAKNAKQLKNERQIKMKTNTDLVAASVDGAIPVAMEDPGSFYECPEVYELLEAAKMAAFESDYYYFKASALKALAAQGYRFSFGGRVACLLSPTWTKGHSAEISAELRQQTAAVIAAAELAEIAYAWRQKAAKVKKEYKGTRLYGAYRRAGIPREYWVD